MRDYIVFFLPTLLAFTNSLNIFHKPHQCPQGQHQITSQRTFCDDLWEVFSVIYILFLYPILNANSVLYFW